MRRVFDDKVDENRRQQNDLRTIAEGQSEAKSGERRAMVDQDEIERPELSYDREPQRDLPCPRESQICPHPGPEDRQQRQHQSPLDSVAVSRREQIEEQRSRGGEQRGDQRSREKFDKAETLERGRRQHR